MLPQKLLLLEVTDSFHLAQLVNAPTRDNTILDLVLTNNKPAIISTKIIAGISDHEIVEVSLNISPPHKKLPKHKIYLVIDLNLNYFSKFQNSNNIDEKWNFFEKGIKLIIDQNTPQKLTSTKLNLPWFTRVQRCLFEIV